MSVDPYPYVAKYTTSEDDLLSLHCGDGRELSGVYAKSITCVDIYQPYLDHIKAIRPEAMYVCMDSLEYAKQQADKSFDVVSLLDGLEHLTKDRGLLLLTELKRIARKHILLFTPNGFTDNHPHNAWGIEGGDEHQLHLSGWPEAEVVALGFHVLERKMAYTESAQYYESMMYVLDV